MSLGKALNGVLLSLCDKQVAYPSSSSSYGRVSMIQVRHKKRMGTKGLSFYHINLLCFLDQMLAVMELNQHLVSSSKTVRPIISGGAQCMAHVKIMWSISMYFSLCLYVYIYMYVAIYVILVVCIFRKLLLALSLIIYPWQ